MAGDWIKMRGALFQSPRLIAMGRLLHGYREFREWLMPSGVTKTLPSEGNVVSDDALRCVTCSLLLRVWSASREFGKFHGDDLFLERVYLSDLDLMAACPRVGQAMAAVGWAMVVEGELCGILLPNFKQHNAPMTNAEKQSEYRSRRRGNAGGNAGTAGDGNGRAAKALPRKGNKTVTRGEESREEENTPLPPKGGEVEIPPELDTPEFREAWSRWETHRRETKHALKPTTRAAQLKKLAAMGADRALAAVEHSITQGYQGIFEPGARPPPANGAADDFAEKFRKAQAAMEATR